MPNPVRFILLFFIIACGFTARAQLTITGFTRDSATLITLPFVSIQVNKKVIAISDADGNFSFTCNIGDTSVFTHVGYKNKSLIHFRDEMNLSVPMKDSPWLLKSITIFGNFKPQGKAKWKDFIKLPNMLENPTGKDQYGMIQTIGVGATISGPISYFTKYERNRRKLVRVKEDLVATVNYREVVNSEKVKADLIELFQITEEAYFKKLESFNVNYPEAAYLKTKQEIIDMLVAFFALKEK
jgi:hypothetical protein